MKDPVADAAEAIWKLTKSVDHLTRQVEYLTFVVSNVEHVLKYGKEEDHDESDPV